MSDPTKPSNHYFSNDDSIKSEPRLVHFQYLGKQIEMITDRGVFSYGSVDKGTAVLLENAPKITPGIALDLGCGTGTLALAMASSEPNSTVYAIDVNSRALSLTSENAKRNHLKNIVSMQPDEVDPAITFQTIWSNPAIRIGKAALHEMLLKWLKRLAVDGEAWLVVQKNLGSDSLQRWLIEQGFAVYRVTSQKGFRLLRVINSRS